MSYVRHARASIASLPAELLLAILKTVFVETREGLDMFWSHEWCESHDECKCDLNEPYLTTWNDNDNLTSPSVFPYALSSVCKRWSDLMLLVPEFWTRLVIFVDTDSKAMASLGAQLSASRNVPFRAHIFSRQDAIYEEITEGAHVQAVVDVLSPHLDRCERLTFDVMHNSSLPSIRRNFNGKYPLLTELSMECKIHNTQPHEINPESEANGSPFLFPNLKYITLTGSAFADAYGHPNWLRGFENKELRLFSISHLSSIDIPDFTLLDFLSALNVLDHISNLELKFVDLPLHPKGDIPRGWAFRVGLDGLLLEGFKNKAFQEFYALAGGSHFESQTIRACELPAGWTKYSYYLELEDINSTEELLSVVPTLLNPSVTFKSCSGLNDGVLERLSVPNVRTGRWCLETLTDLDISNCPGISVQALKELVESRAVESAARGYGTDPDYDDSEQLVPIDALCIIRCGLEFSSEDLEWFRKNVHHFSFCP